MSPKDIFAREKDVSATASSAEDLADGSRWDFARPLHAKWGMRGFSWEIWCGKN
jgi:hypothetical protein